MAALLPRRRDPRPAGRYPQPVRPPRRPPRRPPPPPARRNPYPRGTEEWQNWEDDQREVRQFGRSSRRKGRSRRFLRELRRRYHLGEFRRKKRLKRKLHFSANPARPF